MMDEVYWQPFFNKLLNNLKLFEKDLVLSELPKLNDLGSR